MSDLAEVLIHLSALAHALEREGRYNNAKLLRAASHALLAREAHARELPTHAEGLIAESERAVAALAALDLSPALLGANTAAAAALARGALPMYAETPDPLVCRTCGQVRLDDADEPCPTCGAWAETFARHRPNWWLDALNPITALEWLRATPQHIAAHTARLSDAAYERKPADGGWSLRQVLSHLRDAQDVLAYRVNLLLEEDDPLLESKAVWEWAGQAGAAPVAARDVFASYRASREQTVRTLESIPLKEWWRSGRHTEFGRLTLMQTVSYFAAHETSHGAQLDALIRSA